MEFVAFPKIPRLKREIVITEKIDGTNAQVCISPLPAHNPEVGEEDIVAISSTGFVMRVGSRTRWITPGKNTDNFGFAGWCLSNADELFKLGEGSHFGEWYGLGIQRGYGLTERRFALFNTARWGAHNPNTPACCEVVPLLYQGDFDGVSGARQALRDFGSVAVPGFMQPEGIVVYHSAARQLFKVLLENDDQPKGLAAAA